MNYKYQKYKKKYLQSKSKYLGGSIESKKSIIFQWSESKFENGIGIKELIIVTHPPFLAIYTKCEINQKGEKTEIKKELSKDELVKFIQDKNMNIEEIENII